MRTLARKFHELYEGSDLAHGQFRPSGSVSANGKVEGMYKCLGSTQEPLPATVDHWEAHLKGEVRLACIPINSKNMCRWGTLDFDEYSKVSLEGINECLGQEGFPFVSLPSKSGGVHASIFFKEWVSAVIVQNWLSTLSARMGWATCEIFPKQIELEAGSVGNFINMPYFGAECTLRKAISADGAYLGPKEFVEYANGIKISHESLSEIEIGNSEIFPDGPPCLNTLLSKKDGSLEGGRNYIMFALAVMARNEDIDTWESRAKDLYHTHLKPEGFPEKEADTVIKSVSRKGYGFPCNKSPLCEHCDKVVCASRKYGVGREVLKQPKFGALEKLESDPPLWKVALNNGKIVNVNTETLQNPRLFQRACMDQLNMMTDVPTQKVWGTWLSKLFDKVTTIPVDKSSTPQGTFTDILSDFLTGGRRAEQVDDMLRGMPYKNQTNFYFRLKDLRAKLTRERFNDLKQNEIVAVLHGLGAQNKTIKCCGKSVKIWSVPCDVFSEQTEKFKVPGMAKPEDVV